MRAAALAVALVAGFLGVMYVRFSGDTVPAPPTPRPYAAGQPTCIVFRRESSQGIVDAPVATCGAVRAGPEATSFVPPTPVPQYARIVNTEGDCLNIRATPGPAGQVLACEAEGVALRDLLERLLVDGTIWARVRTPAGAEGWASTQYLELVRQG